MRGLSDWAVAFVCSALVATALVGLVYVAFASFPAFAARCTGPLPTSRGAVASAAAPGISSLVQVHARVGRALIHNTVEDMT